MNKRAILGIFGILVFIAPCAFAVQPTVGEVKDTRTTGQFFAGLEVELNLVGDDLDEVEAIRTEISKAQDDTGKNLVDPEKLEKDFQVLNQGGYRQNAVRIQLKNPARKASSISELSGNLHLYKPSIDPNATVNVPNFLASTGKPLVSPALKSAGVEMTILTKADYDKRQETKKKEAEEAAKKQGMDGGMLEAFGGMFGGFGGMDDNSLAFEIKDPQTKIVKIRVLKSDGTEISRQGSMTSGELTTYSFGEEIPKDARLEIQVTTAKALVAMPMKLQNVVLP